MTYLDVVQGSRCDSEKDSGVANNFYPIIDCFIIFMIPFRWENYKLSCVVVLIMVAVLLFPRELNASLHTVCCSHGLMKLSVMFNNDYSFHS